LLTESEIQKEKALKNDRSLSFDRLKNVANEFAREKALKQRAYMSFAVIEANVVPIENNEHVASFLFVFIIIALFATAAFRQYSQKKKNGTLTFEMGDFFSPWSLTFVIWGGLFVLYFLQGTLDPVGPLFVTNFFLWIGTFIPTSLLTFILTRDDSLPRPVERGKSIDVNMQLFYVLLVVSLLFTILYAKWIYGIVSQFDTEDLLFNIRLYAVYKTDSPGILILTQGLNFSLFLTAIWLYPKISKLTIALIVAINLLLEFSMMEKSGILIMVLSTLFVLYEKRTIKLRSIGITLLGIIVLFFFFNMSKEAQEQDSVDFMDFLGIYVTSPIVAFEKLRITITDGWGGNTFNDVFPYLRYLGIQLESINRLQDFVYVPVPTNVYTIMQPFYNDFGTMGVAVFGLLYGWGAGYVYRKFYDGSNTYKCIYTFLVEVIIIQFYNENLLQQFHIVVETFFFIVLLTATNYKLLIKAKADEVI
jgi:oligosaccharide repeat unit polymerase